MALERRPVIAGNWKMHTTVSEAVALVRALRPRLDAIDSVDRIVCPPFVSLVAVSDALAGSPIAVGAQNLYYEEKGAFTGEIAPGMLAGICDVVIVGHSERRHIFGETDDMINRKVKAALAHGLTPIVCVGEQLEENEAGKTEQVVGRQTRAAFAGIEQLGPCIVAYEPVWAIGTGKAATAEQASTTIDFIRQTIAESYGPDAARAIRIQYGGSVNAANIAEFVGRDGIDGALVGGASLKVADFAAIVETTARVKAQPSR